jgi:hypothetical protein
VRYGPATGFSATPVFGYTTRGGGKRTEMTMPVFAFAFGLVGAAVILRWCLREVRRVNADLETLRARAEPVDRKTMPTLKADPRTGEYRPG